MRSGGILRVQAGILSPGVSVYLFCLVFSKRLENVFRIHLQTQHHLRVEFFYSLPWGPFGRFSKVPRTFRDRKAIRKSTTYLFCKAGLFICCKGNKNENNCKVSCLETPSFWRYKENYVTRNTPEKFRDFRETGPWGLFLESPEFFWAYFGCYNSFTSSDAEVLSHQTSQSSWFFLH